MTRLPPTERLECELLIEHTDVDGTLLSGTTRGDAAAAVVKALGWRWGRNIGAWYLPRSRDRAPMRPLIDQTAQALREAGFVVSVSVDATVSDQAEAQRHRSERSAVRVDLLQRRADRHAAKAEKHDEQSRAISAHIPLGQPILVGHYSQRRHQRDLERLRRHDQQAAEHATLSRQAEAAAHAAEAADAARSAPVTVANRIERLAAAIRRDLREQSRLTRAGNADSTHAVTLADRLAHNQAELAHWQTVREAQIADGTATHYGRDSVAAGDLVRVCGQWRRVVRSNAKSASVETGYSWTDTVPWHKVQDHRRGNSGGSEQGKQSS